MTQLENERCTLVKHASAETADSNLTGTTVFPAIFKSKERWPRHRATPLYIKALFSCNSFLKLHFEETFGE